MKFLIKGKINIALMRELIDEFMDPAGYEIVDSPEEGAVVINEQLSSDRDTVKRELYRKLVEITGHGQKWGALTGVRPVKLAGELIEELGLEGAKERLSSFYFLSDEKISLITDMYLYQKELFGKPPEASSSVYIGIPFCPTRCLYCSFASNQVGDDEIARYFDVLIKEIESIGERCSRYGERAESVYIGGGTPTTLTASQLDVLTSRVNDIFPGIKEFSVEAGRPDTITPDKLEALRDNGVGRISINPQSMKEETLVRIGRDHTPSDIEDAFELASRYDFDVINADIIAGLPGETPDDLACTVERMISLGATNVTVHTLAVKRGSRLHEADKAYHYKASDVVSEMLERADGILSSNEFRPYYLYRQKHMAGAMENTGYCTNDKACLYNVRVMDEHQSTLAMGAGGISKKYYPEENRLVRVPNVTNYQEYISRIDEMIERKDKDYFTEENNAD